MGDMMATQMKKIEELTLHLIEQNKKIESLMEDNKKIVRLTEKIEKLETEKKM